MSSSWRPTTTAPIVPVICEACQIPAEIQYHLAGVQHIDFSVGARANSIDQLIDALKQVDAPLSNAQKPVVAPVVANPRPPQAAPPLPAGPPPFGPGLQAPQRAPQLFEVVAGRWQVSIRNLLGVVGNMTLELAPNGIFQGQVMTPMGVSTVQGQWQLTALGQIVLQGQETNGFLTAPYAVLIQVDQFNPQQIMGVTSAGEQVFWQRLG